jgi:GAF domain-containing protein
VSARRDAHGPASAVLQAIVDAATEATAASEGWILAPRYDRLHVLAAAGDRPGQLMGATVPVGEGTAGYVVASGQPLALSPRADDARATSGVAALLGLHPASVLCVPCQGDDSIAGALEVVDKAGGGRFSLDDVELATLLGGIAGAALTEITGSASAVPSPAELAGGLERLAGAEPARYTALAAAVSALLDRG